MNADDQLTLARTPADDCPACEAKRRHSAEEKAQYHPLAGTGGSREHGAPMKEPEISKAPADTDCGGITT